MMILADFLAQLASQPNINARAFELISESYRTGALSKIVNALPTMSAHIEGGTAVFYSGRNSTYFDALTGEAMHNGDAAQAFVKAHPGVAYTVTDVAVGQYIAGAPGRQIIAPEFTRINDALL